MCISGQTVLNVGNNFATSAIGNDFAFPYLKPVCECEVHECE